MQVLNMGSINIDHVYEVDHFVRPGETLDSLSYRTFAGGKGFNQSVALARAGVSVLHVGKIGQDAGWLLQQLVDEGVDTQFVVQDAMNTGHAVIQVAPDGENAIFLFAGANKQITEAEFDVALAASSPGDYLLLQNETSAVALAIQKAHAYGLRIIFNPAPMCSEIQQYPLEWVDIFVLNESEAEALTGKTDLRDVVEIMRLRFPNAATVLTQGKGGATYFDANTLRHEAALNVAPIDTTAAGDTFIGYFLAELISSGNPESALAKGCKAAAICVTRAGAADSIPLQHEVENYRP
jgi:ribokinase